MSGAIDGFSLAEKTVDKLNESLPTDLTAGDVHQYPEFVKLLTALSQRLTPAGLSTQIQKDLVQAEEELRHEKHRWLLQHILYTELEELLMTFELQNQDTTVSPEDKQVCKNLPAHFQYACGPNLDTLVAEVSPLPIKTEGLYNGPFDRNCSPVIMVGKMIDIHKDIDVVIFHTVLQECLTFAEIGDYLNCSPDPGSKVTLLGLTQQDVKEENPYRQHLPYIQQRLIPQIEERLAKKCENLVNFNDTENESESGLNMAKTTQLPAFVEADKRKLADEKNQLLRDKKSKDKQFRLYYQTLIDSMELLEKLIVKYRLKNQAEHDAVTSEWLAAKCDGLSLKIRLIELQILCDTYSVETVKALQQIRDHLDVATGDCKKKQDQVSKALNTYESVGMGFDDLVKEYRRLKEEVENKQWALSELQESVDTKD